MGWSGAGGSQRTLRPAIHEEEGETGSISNMVSTADNRADEFPTIMHVGNVYGTDNILLASHEH
jgi:hypothetical protein